jgi:hypothetical protein
MNGKVHIEIVELDERDLATKHIEAGGPIAAAVELLGHGNVAVVRVRPATAVKQVAITRAERALAAIRRGLIEKHSLPVEAYVELDEESYGTPVAPFRDRRFLLPHHDGGHRSFLTPSRLDYPDFDPGERAFSASVYWRRHSHKMYQGFLITNVGARPGTTFYYNTLTLLWDAFVHRHARVPSSLSELAKFSLENLRRSSKSQTIHGSRYVTLGALLGSPHIEHHVMPSGPRAESELWPAQYIQLPALCELADQCPCGSCQGPGERLLCHACMETLAKTWPEFRAEYETSVGGELYDLLIGNNLTQLHAADSSRTRTVLPLCIVVDNADGDAYERWLASQWREWFALAQREEKASPAV